MELTEFQVDVYSAKVCPYCKSTTKVVSEEYIYGVNYKGRSMICCSNYPKCDSYVGTHEDDGSPLGRLASKRLRQFKMRAHEHFDKLWMEKYYDRSDLYELLSKFLDLPIDYTHIGFFNEQTCKKVIDWSILKYKQVTQNET